MREDYKLAWWEPEVCKQVLWEGEACKLALLEVAVCMRASRVQVELCKLPSLEGVCIQALQLLHKLALEGSQILDEVRGVQVHTQACLALACIVGELLAEEHSWVLEPLEHSLVLEQEELNRLVLALERSMLAWVSGHCMKASVHYRKA